MVDIPQFDPNEPVTPLASAAPQFDEKSPVVPLNGGQQTPKHDFSWSQMGTDIWPEIKKEAGTAYQGITDLSKRGEQGPVEGMLNTANAAFSVPRLLASPITGAIKSVGGHGMANAEHAVGTLINPKQAAKDNPEEMYETAKSDVDRAMAAARPAGAPIKAPNLFGTEGFEWKAPPTKTVPTESTTPEVVSAADRISQVAPEPIKVPRAFASDSIGTQRAGQLAKNAPFVGNAIPRATGEMVDQLGNAVGAVATHYGEGAGPNVASRIGSTLSGASDVERTGAETATRTSDDALLADWQRAQDEALHRVGQQETETANTARTSDEALLADWQRAQDDALHQVGQHENDTLGQARAATGDMTPQDMGQALIGRLRTEEQAARAEKDRLYGIAGEGDASVTARSARSVHGLVRDTLNEAGRTDPRTGLVDPLLLPASNKMMDELENFSNSARPTRDPDTGRLVAGRPATAQEMEQTRKRLVNLSGAASNDSDRAAAKIIKDQFDDWQGHAYENALFSGSPEALQDYRNARAANASWRQRFYNDRDDADGLINKVVTGEVTPQEMSNWIVGSGQVGAKGTASRLITRLGQATGNDPEAMNTVRAGIANRLFGTTEGATARNPEKIASDIHEFFNGSGQDIANRLFTPQQRQAALNYANAIRRGQEARQNITAEAKLTKPTPMEAGPMKEARQDIAAQAKLTKPTPMEVGPGPAQRLATAVLGKSGKTDEALFSAIDAYSKSGGRGDIKTLADIVRNIPEKDKGDLAGAIVRKLGQSEQVGGVGGGFSLEKFATDWNKYTPQAKAILFGNSGPHRQALDDIALIAQRYKEVGRRFGNPSGTAQNVSTFGALAAMWSHPFVAIPAVVGGAVFAKMLSAPATAQKTAGLFKTAWEMSKNPTSGNMARLTYAGSNFARMAEKLGSNVSVQQFLQHLSSPSPVPASDNGNKPYKGPNLGPLQGHARGGSVKKNNIKGYAEGGGIGDDYNTTLSPEDEQGFQKWKAENAPDDSGVDYDLRGAYLANMQRSPDNGHMGDRFKKPNHPTFSDQSQYATGDQRDRAGTWVGPEGPDQTFVPPTPYADGGSPSFDDRFSAVNDQPSPADTLPEVPDTRPDFIKRAAEAPAPVLWPERMLRSGFTLAHDVMTGEEPLPPPGLRREDYTDIPPPQGPTEDSTWLGKKLGMAPQASSIYDPAYERVQDMAGLAGSGGLGAGAEDASLGSGPFLRPALKYGDKIYKAPIKDPSNPIFFGAEHSDTIPAHLQDDFYKKAMTGEDINDYNFGYLNHKNQFLDRDKAAEYGIKEGLVNPQDVNYNGGILTSTMLLSDTSKPGAALSALEHEPFYSAAEKTIQSAPQQKMHGEQWANWLKNQPGVKPDELQYTGIDDWLRGQKGPVTKQQVQDYIGQNKVQVNDVVKGASEGNFKQVYDKLEKEIGDGAVVRGEKLYGDEIIRGLYDGEYKINELPENLRDSATEFLNSQKDYHENHNPTKYKDYQLPGGENYREHLLTLPNKLDRDNVSPSDTASAKYMDQWDALVKERQALQDKVNDYNRTLTEPEWRKSQVDFEKVNQKMDDLHYKMVDDTMAENPSKYGENYKSDHWDESNILAHARTNDRDVGGVPAMHIEELQSDWHQAGRKKGYQNPNEVASEAEIQAAVKADAEARQAATKATEDAFRKATNGQAENMRQVMDIGDMDLFRKVKQSINEDQSIAQAYEKSSQTHNALNKLIMRGKEGVPDAPFKTSWPELAMKRMIAKAVDEGKSRVSWTPGDAQAARYDLSKQIDRIHFAKTDQGYLIAPESNGREVPMNSGQVIPAEKLEDYVGKEVAQKIINKAENAKPYDLITKLPEDYHLIHDANGRPDEKWGVIPPGQVHGRSMTGRYHATEQEATDRALDMINFMRRKQHQNENSVLENVDLKVGGEGMKGFYDQMMPKMVEKLGKPYGVKVKEGQVQTGDVSDYDIVPAGYGNKWKIVDKKTNVSVTRNMFTSGADAEKWLKENGKASSPVHYFDIPKAMADKVKKEGFPLFSDTNTGMLGQTDSDNKKNVPRPVKEEEKARASGGRVVASNINHEPTEAQKAAGNYSKDHVHIHGMDITIENAKGSTRSGKDADGKEWKATLPSHYGYIKRTEGADKDHLDIYLGPHIRSDKVYVVNQIDHESKEFDEHKIMLGFRDLHHALETYGKAFSDGKGLLRVGSVVPTDIKHLKEWLKTDTTKPYVNGQSSVTSSKVKAEKALPENHKLGMKVPTGGSMCANCRYLASPTTCGNKGFIEWNGGNKLPHAADEYCCDNYQIKRSYHWMREDDTS